MKKIIGSGIAAAVLLALSLAHTALAKSDKADAGKVWVCHRTGQISDGTVLNAAGEPIPAGEAVGRLIEVSANTLATHCGHNDKVNARQTRGACRVDYVRPGQECPF